MSPVYSHPGKMQEGTSLEDMRRALNQRFLAVSHEFGRLDEFERGGRVYNVTHPRFGAVGDGLTDDTEGIQAAVDAISDTTGAVLYFPVGDYRISAPIVTDRRRLFVHGSGTYDTVIRWLGSASGPMFSVGNGAGFTAMPHLKDLTLDGSNQVSGMNLTQVSRAVVSRVRFINHSGYSLSLTSGAVLTVADCVFGALPAATDIGFRLTGAGSGIRLVRNAFATADGIGISLQAASNGLWIMGNVFEPNDIGIDIRLVTSGVHACNVVGNFFETNATTPIRLGGAGAGADPTAVRIVGNEFASAGNGAITFARCDRLIVEANRFGPNVTYGGDLTRLYTRGNDYRGTKTVSTASRRDLDGDYNAAAASYTASNVSTDRSYDANATTVAELADVLGTLIGDLQSYGVIT